MANQNITEEALEQNTMVEDVSAEAAAAPHTHIDFANLDFNDPEAIAAIDLNGVTCTACIEAYAEHFGESEADNGSSLLSGINFQPGNFVANLGYMGTGMLGIFIVIALIMGVTTGLNKLFSGKQSADE